jgi:hypothetical protein
MTWTMRLRNTPSRLKNYLFGAMPYVESNANDDHARPGRKDYSVLLAPPAPNQRPAVRGQRPVNVGPWTVRVTCTTPTGYAIWTLRGAGAGETGQTAWHARHTSTAGTGTVIYLFRAEGLRTTPLAAWSTRRTGTTTS